MEQEELTISMVQADVAWEDKKANIEGFARRLDRAGNLGDIIVLPEMFTTAFSTNARELAEPTESETMAAVRSWAARYDALIAGSFIASEDGRYYNRGFMSFPDGSAEFYDKKHLFIGGEKNIFTPGDGRILINYKGWKISLTICYDLRFPVWLRRCPAYDYDLMLCIAEWPVNRQDNLETLLRARAIENQAYYCLCNRVGDDHNFLHYAGGSQIVDYKGKVLCRANDDSDEILNFTIKKYPLQSNREKFPASEDADDFEIC